MILSVSRRTDIPAFYYEWFFNRIQGGFVMVRNPINKYQVSKIILNTDVVDGIVFWTKNPSPMIPYLNLIKDYAYYFQFTINPYDKTIEPQVPVKKDIIKTFETLSNIIGSDRVIWRYDPILLTDQITVEYHKKYYSYLLNRLKGYTKKCVISFIDMYKKCERNLKEFSLNPINNQNIYELSEYISTEANKYNIKVESCGEPYDLTKLGITPSKCIDDKLIENIIDCKLKLRKDKNQRNECGCVESIDIGAYNTCSHGCKYCYANYNIDIVKKQFLHHYPKSPILIGDISEKDKITIRKVKSNRQNQDKLLF